MSQGMPEAQVEAIRAGNIATANRKRKLRVNSLRTLLASGHIQSVIETQLDEIDAAIDAGEVLSDDQRKILLSLELIAGQPADTTDS